MLQLARKLCRNRKSQKRKNIIPTTLPDPYKKSHCDHFFFNGVKSNRRTWRRNWRSSTTSLAPHVRRRVRGYRNLKLQPETSQLRIWGFMCNIYIYSTYLFICLFICLVYLSIYIYLFYLLFNNLFIIHVFLFSKDLLTSEFLGLQPLTSERSGFRNDKNNETCDVNKILTKGMDTSGNMSVVYHANSGQIARWFLQEPKILTKNQSSMLPKPVRWDHRTHHWSTAATCVALAARGVFFSHFFKFVVSQNWMMG